MLLGRVNRIEKSILPGHTDLIPGSLQSAREILAAAANDCRNQLIRELDSQGDSIYLTKTDDLVLIGSLVGNVDSVGLSGSSVSGNQYVLRVKVAAFDTSQEMSVLRDTGWVEDEPGKLVPMIRSVYGINGQRVYGLDFGSTKPYRQISEFHLAINGRWIPVPPRAFKTLLEPHLLHSSLPIRAYESGDGTLLHIYIFGSDGAGAYMAKLVFDHRRHLVTIAFQGDTGFACEF
jgi:hypothetical protein